MAGKRRLTKAESEALAAVLVFLFKGYFSPLAWRNGSACAALAVYAFCLILFATLSMLSIRGVDAAMPPLIIGAIALCAFAFYHMNAEHADFEKRYQKHHAEFLPVYDRRYALPAGRNKVYAYTIYGKEGLVKIGQTIKKTDCRIMEQLRTADIHPQILWEMYAVTQSGRQFADYDLHSFLVKNGYRRIKSANGRNTEWFQIDKTVLHKEVYRFYVNR